MWQLNPYRWGKWRTNLERKVDKIMSDLAAAKASIDAVVAKMPALEAGIDALNAKITDLQNQLANAAPGTLTPDQQALVDGIAADGAQLGATVDALQGKAPAPAAPAPTT